MSRNVTASGQVQTGQAIERKRKAEDELGLPPRPATPSQFSMLIGASWNFAAPLETASPEPNSQEQPGPWPLQHSPTPELDSVPPRPATLSQSSMLIETSRNNEASYEPALYEHTPPHQDSSIGPPGSWYSAASSWSTRCSSSFEAPCDFEASHEPALHEHAPPHENFSLEPLGSWYSVASLWSAQCSLFPEAPWEFEESALYQSVAVQHPAHELPALHQPALVPYPGLYQPAASQHPAQHIAQRPTQQPALYQHIPPSLPAPQPSQQPALYQPVHHHPAPHPVLPLWSQPLEISEIDDRVLAALALQKKTYDHVLCIARYSGVERSSFMEYERSVSRAIAKTYFGPDVESDAFKVIAMYNSKSITDPLECYAFRDWYRRLALNYTLYRLPQRVLLILRGVDGLCVDLDKMVAFVNTTPDVSYDFTIYLDAECGFSPTFSLNDMVQPGYIPQSTQELYLMQRWAALKDMRLNYVGTTYAKARTKGRNCYENIAYIWERYHPGTLCPFVVTTVGGKARLFALRPQPTLPQPPALQQVATPRPAQHNRVPQPVLPEHSEHSIHACTIDTCTSKYSLERDLFMHLHKKHGEGPLIACTVAGCTSLFQTQSRLANHISKRHAEGPAITYACTEPGCTKQYDEARALRYHIEHKHTEGPAPVFACPVAGCTKVYGDQTSVANHVKHKHPEEPAPVYTCIVPGCTEQYTSEQNMKEHIKRKHVEGCAQEHRCTIGRCTKQYKSRPGLTKHIRQKHRANRAAHDEDSLVDLAIAQMADYT